MTAASGARRDKLLAAADLQRALHLFLGCVKCDADLLYIQYTVILIYINTNII